MQPKNIREVFLAESLGNVSACDVESSGAGKIILSKGVMIGPREISALADFGVDRILVYDKPRVSIIVIGQDILAPGGMLLPGKAYDFSSDALKAALESMRIRPVFVRRIPNEIKAFKKVIPFAVNHSDMIILVIKEIGQSLSHVVKFVGDISRTVFIARETEAAPDIVLNENKKLVFCLPYDKDIIFEKFEKLVQPAILAFMGLTDPKKSLCGMR